MSLRRLICRRRRLLKIFKVLSFIVLLRLVQVSFFTNHYDGKAFIHEFDFVTNRRIVQHRDTCRLPCVNGSCDADIYTFDLPDVTAYEFLSGKKFKEYVIPVKDESVAYGPNLDPLEVFVIPFSHVDPGYGATLEGYYRSKTRGTLTNMVKKLEQYKDMTFQWAETIYLERWWKDISDNVKNRLRALIKDGRIEILSGGWVMPDEAITHYSPVIDQLIEGHQWLWENLGVKPKNNWANDPFGYSSTFPYLWRKSGMESMVILRINQAIKGTLMKKQALEFIWKPFWSNDSANNIFCHIMPYRGYWIGDTCGPYNQHICREYAFMHTNPKDKVVFVTEQNLEERARILYEQYRITAEIYRRDSLGANNKTVPQNLYLPIFLGEDFSYVNGKDFDLIYENYKKLFKYMNSKTEWKIKLKFGTIAEYFSKVKANQEMRTLQDGSRFRTLVGDFLPYTDYQNDFWTGYYSTRSFNKQLSRELQRTLKTADIFHSYAYAQAKSNHIAYESYTKVTLLLRQTRRDLGMFLHHDGITGTSVRPVIEDFQVKLFVALLKARRALKLITSQLLTQGNLQGLGVFRETRERMSMVSVPHDKVMNLSTNFMKGGSFITVLNPSVRQRMDIVSFVGEIKDKYLFISLGQETLKFQKQTFNENAHRISFVVSLPPLSIKTFRIETFKTKKDMNSTYEEDIFQNLNVKSTKQNFAEENNFLLENEYIYVEIDSESGFPKRMKMKNQEKTEIEIHTEVMAYTALRSGAYIFAPDGHAKPFLYDRPMIVTNKGPIVSEIKTTYQSFTLSTKLYNVTGMTGMGVHISTEFDMRKHDKSRNKELVLRFQTNINNGNTFFTDQNGFQLIGRKTRPDRLIEENYFPVTTMMIIEDQNKRLTLHTAQPHGAASLRNGWMEVMLDRRVSRDDGKGLGQGVMDNVLTTANFVLQVETKTVTQSGSQEIRYTFPSESNILMNEILNEPTYTLFAEEAVKFREYDLHEENLKFTALKDSLPCSLSVVGMRNLAKTNLAYDGTSLVLHFIPTLYGLKESSFCENRKDSVTLHTLYPSLNVQKAKETSLTHLHDTKEIDSSEDLRPADMELRSFRIEF